MAHKQIALDAAAFLDSHAARALASPSRADMRRITEIFLSVCYEELGKEPHTLDGQDVLAAVGQGMPGRMGRKDALAAHVPAVLSAFFDHLQEARVVTQAFEIRNALEQATDTFLANVERGESAHSTRTRQDPVVHRASKLGRNDACFCGSGKKFKKCHGKNA